MALNEGVFRGQIQGAAREPAIRAVQRMGYELDVARAEIHTPDGTLAVSLTVTNTGVAPFYYDWPVELAVLSSTNERVITCQTDWRLSNIVPGKAAAAWSFQGSIPALAPGAYHLLLRVAHPLTNGLPLRFANQSQDQHQPGWLTLGEFRLP